MLQDLHIRYPDGRDRALTFSFDDGQISDIRLIEIMSKYKLKSTFCMVSSMCTGEADNYVDASQFQKVYFDNGMEIACHAAHHAPLADIPPAAALCELLSDREALERMTGRTIRGLAFPYGNWNAAVCRMVAACGFSYARATTKLHAFTQPQDWLQMPLSCRQGEEMAFTLAESFRRDRIAPGQDAYLFHIMGHSFECERPNGWERITQLLERLSGDEAVWYATIGEICDYTRAFRALEVSADSRYVRNPSYAPVWFTYGTDVYRIGGGEMLTLPSMAAE